MGIEAYNFVDVNSVMLMSKYIRALMTDGGGLFIGFGQVKCQAETCTITFKMGVVILRFKGPKVIMVDQL